MLFKAIQTLALALATAVTVQAQSGGFAHSCDTITVFPDGLVAAICGTTNGGSQQATIEMNACFVNLGGYVAYRPGGGVMGTCSDLEQDSAFSSTVHLTCGNGQGGVGHDTVELNDYIGNINGVLVC